MAGVTKQRLPGEEGKPAAGRTGVVALRVCSGNK